MRRILVSAVLVLTLAAATSCTPAATISARPDPYPRVAETSYVRGTVEPATATTKVVLQRTIGGKWVDWKACDSEGCNTASPPRVRRANVDQVTGGYAIAYPVQLCGVVLHLRVRTLEGGSFSKGFYTQADITEGC